MTKPEREDLIARLVEYWPGKIKERELGIWCNSLDHYRLGDVLDALDQFKTNSRYTPRIAEIRKWIDEQNAREAAAKRTAEQKPAPPMSEVIRRHRDQIGRAHIPGTPAWLVLVAYWRGQYLRYAKGQPKASNEIQRQRNEAGLASEALRVTAGCRGSLIAERLRMDWANAMAASVTEDPMTFEERVQDLRRELPGLMQYAAEMAQEEMAGAM